MIVGRRGEGGGTAAPQPTLSSSRQHIVQIISIVYMGKLFLGLLCLAQYQPTLHSIVYSMNWAVQGLYCKLWPKEGRMDVAQHSPIIQCRPATTYYMGYYYFFHCLYIQAIFSWLIFFSNIDPNPRDYFVCVWVCLYCVKLTSAVHVLCRPAANNIAPNIVYSMIYSSCLAIPNITIYFLQHNLTRPNTTKLLFFTSV